MVDLHKLDPDNVENILEELNGNFVFEGEMCDWANNYARQHMGYFKEVINQIKLICGLKKVGRLLDVGGVPGYVTAILKYVGFDIDVVDIEPERSKNLFDSMNITYNKVDIEDEPFPLSDEMYDLVMFTEVFEHLRHNPLHALREIRRVLKPGGICLLTTPQITPLMRWEFLFGHDYQPDVVTECVKLDMGHIRLYSRTEVKIVLDHLKFKVVNIGGLGSVIGKYSIISFLLERFVPDKMRGCFYVWAEKPV